MAPACQGAALLPKPGGGGPLLPQRRERIGGGAPAGAPAATAVQCSAGDRGAAGAGCRQEDTGAGSGRDAGPFLLQAHLQPGLHHPGAPAGLPASALRYRLPWAPPCPRPPACQPKRALAPGAPTSVTSDLCHIRPEFHAQFPLCKHCLRSRVGVEARPGARDVQVEIEGKVVDVYVLKRPHMDDFMASIAGVFEIIVFTASLSKYADPLLDLLDKPGVVRWRLFR